MIGKDAYATFRGLPLTEEQNSEILHYINHKKRLRAPLDEREITAMLADMLYPPLQEEVSFAVLGTSIWRDAERARVSIDDVMDITEAQENKSAIMELEAMKHAGGCPE